MKLTELGLLYCLVGLGCALAVMVARPRAERHAMDAVLMVGLWSVYGPFVLAAARGMDEGASGSEVAFLVALRRAQGTPLSVLLPGPSRAEALSRYGDALWAMQWKYSDMEASATRALPAATPPPFHGDTDALVKGRATFAGPPAALVDALLDIQAQVGVPVEFAARSHFPLLGFDAQVDLMAQLAEGVAPHV